ncbi:hypothetical protein FOA43_004640 [Brettanomyces nanus]|uniref:Rab-GAP TBC domain-containing protein n=1 Tax=Eeniella nana TaxID=13502 RepID=A0A875S8M5_EENNA|nr:uncharacterized protein FOA43_004640 [Brettanomyces nanus]QPG77233.1 hypothetical protein FOA43_004640 [Brettanomyces nanus]
MSSYNDYVFSSEESSVDDIQQKDGGGNIDSMGEKRPSFFRSLTSLGRSSHEYSSGNVRTSISSSDHINSKEMVDNSKAVIGAGFSHMDRVLPEQIKAKHHHRSHERHHHQAALDDGLGDDNDWNPVIELPTRKVKSLTSTTRSIKSSLTPSVVPQPAYTAASPKTSSVVRDPDYPCIRPDWPELLNDPYGILTKLQPPEHDRIRYGKIVRALTKQPFDMYELKKQTWGGIPQCVRSLVWQILVGYLPVNMNTRGSVLSRKRKEYVKSITQLFQGSKDEAVWHQIKIDVPRTNPGTKLYSYESTHRSLERILYLWAVRHPASGYVQGINDLVTPFFQVFLANYLVKMEDIEIIDPHTLPKDLLNAVEADTYWCLTKVLDTIQDNYIHEQPGIIRQIKELKDLITRDEPVLAQHLEDENLDFIQFAFRWMNCLLMREFDLHLIIRMWDTYLSDFPNGFSTFHVYVCCAYLRRFGPQLVNMEFQDIIMFLQDSSKTRDWTEEDIEMMLSEAYVWQSLYENALAHLK